MTAFDLGPCSLSVSVFSKVMELLESIVGGDAAACSAVWDDSLDLTQPLRSVLRESATLFPAEIGVMVQVRKCGGGGLLRGGVEVELTAVQSFRPHAASLLNWEAMSLFSRIHTPTQIKPRP